MQQIFEGPNHVYSPQHIEAGLYEINAFYAEMFGLFISREHLTHKGSKYRNSRQLIQ